MTPKTSPLTTVQTQGHHIPQAQTNKDYLNNLNLTEASNPTLVTTRVTKAINAYSYLLQVYLADLAIILYANKICLQPKKSGGIFKKRSDGNFLFNFYSTQDSSHNSKCDEEETITSLPHARLIIQRLKQQQQFNRYILAQTNMKLLQLTGHVNIFRVIEELEKSHLVREVRQLHRDKNWKNLPRKELWSLVLEDPSIESEVFGFYNLLKLQNNGVPVAEVLSELCNFASKDCNTTMLDSVLLNTEKCYSPDQVFLI